MDWGKIADIATVFESIAVIGSLVFIYFQLKQSNKLARANNAQLLVEHAGTFNFMLAGNKELSQLWYSEGKGLESDHGSANTQEFTVKAQQYRELLIQWLILHENVYYQFDNDLLDEALYKAWEQDLKYTVQHHNMKLISDVETMFSEGFVKHLAGLNNASYPPAAG